MIASYLLLLAAYGLARLDLAVNLHPPLPAWAWAAATPLLCGALGVGITVYLVGRFRRASSDFGPMVRMLGRTLLLYRCAVVALFLFLVHGLGWAAFVADVSVGWPFLSDLILLLPYLVSSLALEATTYPVVVDTEALSLSRHLGRAGRAHIVLTVIYLAGGAVLQSALTAGPARLPVVEAILALTGTLALLLLFPWLLRLLWTMEPLEQNETRESLEALSRDAGWRISDILVWDPGGHGPVNAAVTGLTPFLRYVVFTPGLLESLTLEETRAVLAHEMGHVARFHTPVLLAVIAAWAGFSTALAFLPGLSGPLLWIGALLLAMAHMALLVALVRLFEKDADLFAAQTLSDTTLYTRTLEKVAVLNGDTAEVGSLSHPTIRDRVQHLTDILESEERKSLFMSRLRLFKRAGPFLLGLSLACAAASVIVALLRA